MNHKGQSITSIIGAKHDSVIFGETGSFKKASQHEAG